MSTANAARVAGAARRGEQLSLKLDWSQDRSGLWVPTRTVIEPGKTRHRVPESGQVGVFEIRPKNPAKGSRVIVREMAPVRLGKSDPNDLPGVIPTVVARRRIDPDETEVRWACAIDEYHARLLYQKAKRNALLRRVKARYEKWSGWHSVDPMPSTELLPPRVFGVYLIAEVAPCGTRKIVYIGESQYCIRQRIRARFWPSVHAEDPNAWYSETTEGFEIRWMFTSAARAPEIECMLIRDHTPDGNRDYKGGSQPLLLPFCSPNSSFLKKGVVDPLVAEEDEVPF